MDSIELLDVKSKKAKEYILKKCICAAVQVVLFLEQLFCSACELWTVNVLGNWLVRTMNLLKYIEYILHWDKLQGFLAI